MTTDTAIGTGPVVTRGTSPQPTPVLVNHPRRIAPCLQDSEEQGDNQGQENSHEQPLGPGEPQLRRWLPQARRLPGALIMLS